MATAQTQTEKQLAGKGSAGFAPLYAVILHNDDVNSVDHVVRALLESVPQLSEADAVRVTFEAHTNGRSVVIVCPLEPAELYRDRITSFSLGCTLERA